LEETSGGCLVQPELTEGHLWQDCPGPDADGFQASPVSQAAEIKLSVQYYFSKTGWSKELQPYLFVAVYSMNLNCHDLISEAPSDV